MASTTAVISSATPIMTSILSHLPMRDLNRCSCVCKLWWELAQSEKKRRAQFSWMFWINRSFSQSKKGPVREIDQHISDVLEHISSWPRLAILICSNAFYDDQAVFMQATQHSETPMVDHLKLKLPADCLLVGTSSDGIVGTSTLGDSCTEVENIPGFTCLLLPKMPGVEIYPFVIKESEDLCNRQGAEKWKFLSDDDLLRLTNIPVDQTVKALVFFCTLNDNDGADAVIQTLLYKQKNRLALGGALVDTLIAPNRMLSRKPGSPHSLGIAFCGRNVEAASVMLKSNVRRKETVEQLLLKLKKVGLPERKSFAFMFACVGRGEQHYKERNVEASIFQKVFPKTPLFGIFGNGEIGLGGVLSSNSSASLDYNPEKNRKVVNGYTTVFVLVSITNGV